MKMLKELKGKRVIVEWIKPRIAIMYGVGPMDIKINYRMEDYDNSTSEIWIKLRSISNPKQTSWHRFSEVQSIGRVP